MIVMKCWIGKMMTDEQNDKLEVLNLFEMKQIKFLNLLMTICVSLLKYLCLDRSMIKMNKRIAWIQFKITCFLVGLKGICIN